jgi:hypothetical protein
MQQTWHFYCLGAQNLGKGIKINVLVYTVPLHCAKSIFLLGTSAKYIRIDSWIWKVNLDLLL